MSFIITYLSPPAVILINLSESREEPFLNIILEDPPAFTCIASMESFDLILISSSNLKSTFDPLFWITALTPVPFKVRDLLSILDTWTLPNPPGNLIWAISTSLSIISESLRITFAEDILGIPLLQLLTLDHNISPPALVKVDWDITFPAILPELLITTSVPPISILFNCSGVIPLELEPKLMTLSLKPLITTFPLPQFDEELSVKATSDTEASRLRLRLPDPIVNSPTLPWFALNSIVKSLSEILISPLNILTPFKINFGLDAAPGLINTPFEINVPSALVFAVINALAPKYLNSPV